MKKHTYIALIILCLLLPIASVKANPQIQSTAPKFLTLIPDLPLMNGMIELEEQNLIFDKADGRIIESQIILENSTIDKAQNFYRAALPQFGWIAVGNNNYKRDQEMITFYYEQDGSTVLLNLVMKSAR